MRVRRAGAQPYKKGEVESQVSLRAVERSRGEAVSKVSVAKKSESARRESEVVGGQPERSARQRSCQLWWSRASCVVVQVNGPETVERR